MRIFTDKPESGIAFFAQQTAITFSTRLLAWAAIMIVIYGKSLAAIAWLSTNRTYSTL